MAEDRGRAREEAQGVRDGKRGGDDLGRESGRSAEERSDGDEGFT